MVRVGVAALHSEMAGMYCVSEGVAQLNLNIVPVQVCFVDTEGSMSWTV